MDRVSSLLPLGRYIRRYKSIRNYLLFFEGGEGCSGVVIGVSREWGVLSEIRVVYTSLDIFFIPMPFLLKIIHPFLLSSSVT